MQKNVCCSVHSFLEAWEQVFTVTDLQEWYSGLWYTPKGILCCWKRVTLTWTIWYCSGWNCEITNFLGSGNVLILFFAFASCVCNHKRERESISQFNHLVHFFQQLLCPQLQSTWTWRLKKYIYSKEDSCDSSALPVPSFWGGREVLEKVCVTCRYDSEMLSFLASSGQLQPNLDIKTPGPSETSRG